MSIRAAEDPQYNLQSLNLSSDYDALFLAEYLDAYRSSYIHQPELRLMAAVLEDAIDCYMRHLSGKTRRALRLFGETEEWFFHDEGDELFSFEIICSYLGIDPGYVRRGLLQFSRKMTEMKHPVRTGTSLGLRRVA